jgi:alpha-amylase/alpha-mannosidase (GH57 family)
VCIHAHFYQPPRENPWLETIEAQESARPWHDWNERINAECYRPNTEARILAPDGMIAELVNNYEHISFNFGPTLLSWMERHAGETYHAVLEADKASVAQRSGHGNALAQAYNHIIMPLASERDKRTQIVWGVEDFSYRFGRDPEGMWLPETAVDVSVLSALASEGIRFTILSPYQAARLRAPELGGTWRPLAPGEIDPTRPYRACLPGGREIALFFYDGPISRAIAFERLLDNGDSLRLRLMDAFSEVRDRPQLAHVATDGESYGHHHRFGEMALAYAIKGILADPTVRLTNYGEFLSLHPPEVEVAIIENSSWSCAHGLGRWSADCGCRLEDKPGWNQSWRGPLRKALDKLRDRVDAVFDSEGRKLFKDPWKARDAYIRVVLDRERQIVPFLDEFGLSPMAPEDAAAALSLLEAQRSRMLMYTSCGWFFDDIAGIESIQLLRYAARCARLIAPFDPHAEQPFLEELQHAVSNRPPRLNGAQLFAREAEPHFVDLRKAAAHAAISSLFAETPTKGSLGAYLIEVEDYAAEIAGDRRLAVSRAKVRNLLTTETGRFVAAALHLGGMDLRCSVGAFTGAREYTLVKTQLFETFARHSLTELVRRLDAFFPGDYYALNDLFYDERIRIIDELSRKIFEVQAALLDSFYLKNKGVAAMIREGGAPLPDVLLESARFYVRRAVARELARLKQGEFPDKLKGLLEEARRWNVSIDLREAERVFGARILELVRKLEHNPRQGRIIEMTRALLDLARELEINATEGEAQTVMFRICGAMSMKAATRLPAGFRDIAALLRVRVPTPLPHRTKE